jgi:hypothetical protein
MSILHSRCLLLNADYSPISVISWKKAFTWHIKYENCNDYGIEIIDFYKNDFITGTHNKKYPVPAVAKTRKFFRHNNNTVLFSRKNLFVRDDYTCQYCGTRLDIKNLTYDHVIPKSKWNYDHGSPTTWTNIVTACVRCNLYKSDRTPKQANMSLIKLPIKPNKSPRYLPVAHHLRKIKDEIPNEWKIYLPDSYL